MKTLTFIDCESTGTDPYSDRIVELAIIQVGPGPAEEYHALVNPARSIPREASEVHGIYDDDVADAPVFGSIAEVVQELLTDAVLVGYASRRFDVPLIDSELRRVGQRGLPRDRWGCIDVPEIDLFEVWRRSEPRTLVQAALRFAGIDLVEDAHGAKADAQVLPDVLMGMAREFALEKEDMRDLSFPEWGVDRDGKFRWEDGVVYFDFGKHKGKPAHEQEGYLQWMISADFSPEVKAWCKRLINDPPEPVVQEAPIEDPDDELPF